jgi:hypothetical protein
MHSKVDVCFDPALFPRGRSLFSERDTVYSCIAAGVEEQATYRSSRLPCLCDGLVVSGQLQHFRVGIFPTNAPAVVGPFKVRDGSKASSIPCGILFFVPMALQRFQSGMDRSVSPLPLPCRSLYRSEPRYFSGQPREISDFSPRCRVVQSLTRRNVYSARGTVCVPAGYRSNLQCREYDGYTLSWTAKRSLYPSSNRFS